MFAPRCYAAIALSLTLSLLRRGDGMRTVVHRQDSWATSAGDPR